MSAWMGFLSSRQVGWSVFSQSFCFLDTRFISPIFENQQPKFYMRVVAMNSTDFEI